MAAGEKSDGSASGSALHVLRRLHDVVTTASFQLAVLCLATIVVAYCYEVVARYAFNAPTVWANPLVSYLLCALIFLALPEMTRTSAHISINLLIDAVPPQLAGALNTAIRLTGLAACVFGAWITATASIAQFIGGIETISYLPIPKWLVSGLIPYGLASAALYFLRQLMGDVVAADAKGPDV